MTRYLKIPLLVSAVQVRSIDQQNVEFDGGGPDTEWLDMALSKNVGDAGGLWVVKNGLRIGTAEGILRVNVGDYIVRGTKGEIYPVRRDIFEDTYRSNGH
jgi:hypothetical protein